MIAKFARLEFEFFTRPSKPDFLKVYQIFVFYVNKIDHEVTGSTGPSSMIYDEESVL
jgi:hypothetical protein